MKNMFSHWRNMIFKILNIFKFSENRKIKTNRDFRFWRENQIFQDFRISDFFDSDGKSDFSDIFDFGGNQIFQDFRFSDVFSEILVFRIFQNFIFFKISNF